MPLGRFAERMSLLHMVFGGVVVDVIERCRRVVAA